MDKNKKKLFIQSYRRPYYWETDSIRFFLYSLLLFLFIATFFFSKAYENRLFDVSKAKLSQKKLRQIYIDLGSRQQQEKQISEPNSSLRIRSQVQSAEERRQKELSLRQRIQDELKKSGLLDKGRVDTSLVNQLKGKTKIELAKEDELDDILGNFVSAYRKEKAKEFELSSRGKAILDLGPTTRIREATFSRQRVSVIDLPDDITLESDRFIQGYRTKDEIKNITRKVLKQDYLFKSCMMKIKRFFPKESFFFKLQFNIDSLGKVKLGSIKITDTNVKDKSFKDCIIKRCKYFRGFSKALKPNAMDYIFRKKYVF